MCTNDKLPPNKRIKGYPRPFHNLGCEPLRPPAIDLSPTSVFPPTPLDLFTTILPLTPPDVTKSPRYVKELWDDFDRFHTSSRTRFPPPPPPSPVPEYALPMPALPRLGVWRKSTSMAKQTGSTVIHAPPPLPLPIQAVAAPFPLKPNPPPAQLLKEKCHRHPRGSYRCRKCGGAKRAHDCPFACRQKSMGTQTSLEITGTNLMPAASPAEP